MKVTVCDVCYHRQQKLVRAEYKVTLHRGMQKLEFHACGEHKDFTKGLSFDEALAKLMNEAASFSAGRECEMIPTIDSYGHYANSNYGLNTLRVEVGNLVLFFSYKTLVAFRSPETGLVCRENEWGPTTGKHLNWIQPDKKRRVSGEEFGKQWNSIRKSLP